MPAGTPKVALFGGISLVPGGCQTFNAPGTFTVPVGVTKINLVGKGASGNSGNAGNPGGDGAGGTGGKGGCARNVSAYCGFYGQYMCVVNLAGRIAGNGSPSPGSSGNSGTAGNAGSSSTGFSKTFPGGSGGNAGTGGTVGASGNPGNIGSTSVTYCGGPLATPSNTRFASAGSGGSPGGSSGGGSCPGINCCHPAVNPQRQAQKGGPGGNPGGGAGGTLRPSSTGCGFKADPRGCPGTPYNSPRGGGGGGAGSYQGGNTFVYSVSGGGGGGGAGSAGNAGNPGNPGSSANPTSFNCVSVCPGGSYPLTVNGQIVVSWNPQ